MWHWRIPAIHSDPSRNPRTRLLRFLSLTGATGCLLAAIAVLTFENHASRLFAAIASLSLGLALASPQRREERFRRDEVSQFRAFFDESFGLVALLQPDGTLVQANATTLELGGVVADQVRGRPFWDCSWWMHDPIQRERVREGVLRAATGESVRLETTYRDAAGRVRELDLAIRPLRNDDGSVRMLLPEGRDITNRKAAELALRESEERFRALVERAPVGITFGRDRAIVYANPVARRIFGWEGPEFGNVLNIPILDTIAPDSRPAALARLVEREQGRDPGADHSTTLLRHDGSCFPAHIVSPRVVLSDGLVSMWFVTDLTERRKAETAAARLAAIIEQSPDDVILAGQDQRIEYVNPAFVERSGMNSSAVTGKPLCVLFEAVDSAGGCADILGDLSHGACFHGRSRVRRDDGAASVYEVRACPIRDPSGAICGYVVMRRDITRHVEIEKTLANAERLHAIGTLAGGIAHDFNNVLGTIIGYSEMARRNVEEDSAPWKEIGLALKAAQRASDLVSQILAFARQPTEPLAALHPKPILKEALKFLYAVLPAGVEIREGIESDALVESNPSEIQRLLVNLCTNAVLAMTDSGGVLEVKFDDTQVGEGEASALQLPPGRYVRLTVRDTGCGIPTEVRGRIFEPFFTTRPEGSGTGMGLAVVHGIVASRGGAVDVESRVGEGSTFSVYLPTVEEPERR